MFQQLGQAAASGQVSILSPGRGLLLGGAAALAPGEPFRTKCGSHHLLARTPPLAQLWWVWGMGGGAGDGVRRPGKAPPGAGSSCSVSTAERPPDTGTGHTDRKKRSAAEA